jgi:hypothetical protein
MNKTLADVRAPGGALDLAKVMGKDVLRIEGRISSEFGEPVFVLTQIVFTDRATVHCEGEHDMPYVTPPYSDGDPGREMEQTLNALWTEIKKERGED